MDFNRYKFNINSFSKIKEFLELVENKPSVSKPINNAWSKLLPKDNNLIQNLQKRETDEIISLSDDISNVSLPKSEIESSIEADSQNNEYVIEDLAVKIQQQLIAENGLSNETIITLKQDYKVQQLEQLFIYLRDHLEDTLIYAFGESILQSNSIEKNFIAVYYCQYFLIKKIQEEDSVKTTKLFNDFLNSLPQIVCPQISNILINCKEDCPIALQEILNDLKIENKHKILKEFILNCTKLECGHFLILDKLLADDLDLGVIKKLIELLVISANQYNTNKTFGKFLFNVIQRINDHIQYFKEDLRIIVENHKTTWKKKALEMLENSGHNSYNFSQTFHF